MKSTLQATGVALALALAVPAASWAQDPAAQPDGSWISISGVVTSATGDAFILDYGEGLITVEMDDWDWYQEGQALIAGDDVTVYGRVDDDLYETASIEASSVYVKDLNTYFYASDADEEDVAFTVVTTPMVVAWMELTGNVTSIDGREFTLDTGKRQIQVDTSTMPYNPLDDEGFQKINKGDRVKVSGNMDFDLFERKELMADTIVTLAKDKTKKSS